MSYQAPVQDLLFNLQHIANLDTLAQEPGFESSDLETAKAILQECAKFNESVIAPLNQVGDTQPARFENGIVHTSKGFKEAFKQYVEAGWQALTLPTVCGGQGLPRAIGTACEEIFQSANMSFALCPMLTSVAIEALLVAGSKEQKALYIEKLISGQWTGTMNLTEPHAGSDLAQIRSRAVVQKDGSYKLFGTKTFITYGEHDYTENILHLVLARVEGAPEGIQGISLFLVPKMLHDDTGNITGPNDVICTGIEHKLGIMASPTCVMQYGDQGGAVAYLVGEENHGLEYMFIMMNAARFNVGVQGVAISEAAYQQAARFARDRVQSRPVDGSSKTAVPIVQHPDVRRMLMTMRAYTEASRALAFAGAAAYDRAQHHQDAAVRAENVALYDFLMPLVKGYATEVSQIVASLGIQVHGGMGFIEETGAAQYYRDSRILTIYEGTTAIQANDLIGRKTLRDAGVGIKKIAAQVAQTETELATSSKTQAQRFAKRLGLARQALLQVVDFVVDNGKSNPNAVFAGSVPYLMLTASTLAGWQIGRGMLAALEHADDNPDFMRAKVAVAYFYGEHNLAQAPAMADSILNGADAVLGMALEDF